MSMKKSMYDAVIVGGGAAGMFAACVAGERGLRVLLLEKNGRLGKKLAITGKGRCNVTNNCLPEEVLKNIPRNGRFLYSSVYGFPPERMMAWLEARDCPLKTERGNRVFPVSDRSASVIAALEQGMRQGGVRRRQSTVTRILVQEGQVTGVLTAEGPVNCEKVVLCTGWASYPLIRGDGRRLSHGGRLGTHRSSAHRLPGAVDQPRQRLPADAGPLSAQYGADPAG